MTGLLLKDMLYFKNMKKNLLFLLLFYMVFSLVSDSAVFLTYMIPAFGVTFSILPFSYDNYGQWSEYQYALPVTRTTAVRSRYLFGLLVVAASIVCTWIALGGFFLFKGTVGNLWDMVGTCLGESIAILFLQSVLFPVIYQFGIEKGRLFLIAIAVGIVAVVSFLAKMVETNGAVVLLTEENLPVVIGGVGVFVVVLYVVSMMLSIWIEKGKQK